MNSRQLIVHTRNILEEYESVRMGIDFSGMVRERNLAAPLIVDDLDLLDKYLKSKNIENENQISFIRETYLGCIRQSRILEETLKHFNKSAAVNLLQKDYYLFQGTFCSLFSNYVYSYVEIRGDWVLIIRKIRPML
jgi:hypothetical protein